MRISSTRRPPVHRRAQNLSSPTNPKPDSTFKPVLLSSAASVGSAAIALSGATQVDKLKHIGVAGAATLALGSVGINPAIAAGTVFIGATVGKEVILDLALGMGTPSVLDATANLAGVLAGFAVLQAVKASGDGTPRASASFSMTSSEHPA